MDDVVAEGERYERGHNGEGRNSIKAAECYKRASDGESPSGMCHYARCLENGFGVPRDKYKAFELYTAAAERGDGQAMFDCGRCLKYGVGTVVDTSKAAQYQTNALKKKNKDAICAAAMSLPGDEKDKKKAELRKAAAESKEGVSVVALSCLWNEADDLQSLKKAAEYGSTSAQTLYGYYLEQGGELKQAYSMYGKAARAGNVQAMHNLGLCFMDGKGTEVNEERAAWYFGEAASRGNAESQRLFGIFLYQGRGVEIDTDRAVMYFQKAAEAGDEVAKQILNALPGEK